MIRFSPYCCKQRKNGGEIIILRYEIVLFLFTNIKILLCASPVSCIFQCAKLLLTVCPATMFHEVRGKLYHGYPIGSAERTALQEGDRLQPLVAAARQVREVASSLILRYYL